MSTSLSRQLEQLRTASIDRAKTGNLSSLASLGPSILDIKSGHELSADQLEILAREAFEQLLAADVGILGKFKTLIFPDFKETDEGEPKQEGVTFENLLVILSPHLRQKHCQFLLQYLINRHRVHEACTEQLFFACLQHHEFTFFHRVVDSLPLKLSPEESRPRWVEHFKLACHPATTVGLHRHLASDRGFFGLVCDTFISVTRHHVPLFQSYSKNSVSYNGLIQCFVKCVLGALRLVGSISEQQTHHVMQVR